MSKLGDPIPPYRIMPRVVGIRYSPTLRGIGE
ncbi:hypothetical protein VP150E351_P0065 [Vibrio phage 150E35-1]|nr:hypothetical protein VP150E351_P0065 [Vibrio phage 150E35-1]